jgi:histone acetyltransferase (RNA polymerase elongator complex component)
MVALYNGHGKTKSEPVELAFYGGNFTGMALSEQARLLEMADTLIRDGLIHQVRIATRPDDLPPRTLDLLEKHQVRTIEMGVQSLVDDVLSLARRGHTAEDVARAVRLAKDRGFTVSIHLMAGLPGDDQEKFAETVQKTIDLRPDMVRLHPTLVFKETPLAKMYQTGEYNPLTLSEAIALCKKALVQFEKARIPLIRLGLQETELMKAPGSVLAGPFHPAFRSLVEASLFMDMATRLLLQGNVAGGKVSFSVSPRDVSSFRGEKNGNIHDLRKSFSLDDIAVHPDPDLERGALVLGVGDYHSSTLRRTEQF